MKQIGLWIDHKRAVILTMSDDGDAIHTIESDIEHNSIRGAKRMRQPYGAQYPKGDDHLDKQYENHLGKYYDKVMAALRGAEAVMIFGPGEAKLELKKRLDHWKAGPAVVGVFTADKMTERQFAALVRNHLEEAVP